MAALRGTINDPTFSDIAFVAEGKKIHVHKVILSARSPYFKKMFQQNKAAKEVVVKEASFAVRALVHSLARVHSRMSLLSSLAHFRCVVNTFLHLSQCVMTFLEYLYTGQANVPLELADALATLAAFYEVRLGQSHVFLVSSPSPLSTRLSRVSPVFSLFIHLSYAHTLSDRPSLTFSIDG